jgi:hypothetical protein
VKQRRRRRGRRRRFLGPLPQLVGTNSGGTSRRTATYLTTDIRTVINRNVETGSDLKSF